MNRFHLKPVEFSFFFTWFHIHMWSLFCSFIQMLGFYEEIKSLHSSLDLYKNGGSCVDRKQFLCLNGGTAWTRNFKNSGYVHIPATAFNHAGCMHPLLLTEMLDKKDPEGFNDRYKLNQYKLLSNSFWKLFNYTDYFTLSLTGIWWAYFRRDYLVSYTLSTASWKPWMVSSKCITIE